MASEGGEWVPVASMSRARGSLGVASVSGQVVACGGGVHEAQYDSVEMCAHGGSSNCACDASTMQFMCPVPAPCAFCFKHVASESFGWCNRFWSLMKHPDRFMLTFAVLWARYDAATDRWLAAASMMSRRYALGAAALDNCIYAVRCS